MAVKDADKLRTTNAKNQSQNIALLITALFLIVFYFLKEFYIQREPAQITSVSSAAQTVFEVEDSSGNSKVYVLSKEASLKDVTAKTEKPPLNPPLSKGERGGLNYSDKVKTGSKVTISKDGSAQIGLMSGEKHLIFFIPLNINKAAAQDFEAMPGIGPKLGERIIEKRKKLGGFKTIYDIKKVKGIGEKKFEKIKGMISAE